MSPYFTLVDEFLENFSHENYLMANLPILKYNFSIGASENIFHNHYEILHLIHF